MNIIVLNLPRDITEAILEDLFKPYGDVESCNVVMDKERNTSKGFGFVTMKDDKESGAAIKALHGKQVGNQKIRVKIAEERA